MKIVIIILVLFLLGCEADDKRLIEKYNANKTDIKFCIDECIGDQIDRFKHSATLGSSSVGAKSFNEAYSSMKDHCIELYEGMQCVRYVTYDLKGCILLSSWGHHACPSDYKPLQER